MSSALLFIEHGHKLAYRNVRIIAVQHVDIHVICLQPRQALLQLADECLGIAVRSMRSLIQKHHLFTGTTIFYPVSKHLLARTTSIDIASIKTSATMLEEIVEHHGSVRPRLLIVNTHHQPRDRLLNASNRAIFHAMPWTCDQGALMDRQCLPNRFFNVIDNTKGGTPAIKRLHIPQRVVPGHRRSLPFVKMCGNRISFQGILITRIIDSNPLDGRLLILLHKNAEVIASTWEPGRRKQDGTLGTKDTHHILPIDLHTCEELCHNITGKKQRCNRILVDVRHLTNMTDSGKLHRLSHSLARCGTSNEPSHRSAMGFSQSTCFPASAALMAHSAWKG